MKHKTVGAKGRQIFSVKAQKITFFSGRAKQNEVGGKERLGRPALVLVQKRDTQITLEYSVNDISHSMNT